MAGEISPPQAVPSTAGTCSTCGKHAEKLYGGEGRFPVECIDCWCAGWEQEMAVARATEEARYAD